MDNNVSHFIKSLRWSDYINEQSDVVTDSGNLHRIRQAYPDIMNQFLSNYDEYKKYAENMFGLVRYYPIRLDFDIELIKNVLATETDVVNIDACLQMLETYNMDHALDISFVRDYAYQYEWLKEYAYSISE